MKAHYEESMTRKRKLELRIVVISRDCWVPLIKIVLVKCLQLRPQQTFEVHLVGGQWAAKNGDERVENALKLTSIRCEVSKVVSELRGDRWTTNLIIDATTVRFCTKCRTGSDTGEVSFDDERSELAVDELCEQRGGLTGDHINKTLVVRAIVMLRSVGATHGCLPRRQAGASQV